MKALIVAVAMALLVGCETQQHKQHEIGAAKAQESAADDAKCQSYGAKPGSDAYVDCRVQLDAQREQIGEVRRQRAMQMLIHGQKPQTVYQVPGQINCTSATYGQTTNTNCH